jgi:hypothetical protein
MHTMLFAMLIHAVDADAASAGVCASSGLAVWI